MYDSLLAQAGSRPLADVFRAFPDDLATLRAEGLAFFNYTLVAPRAGAREDAGGLNLETLLERGIVRADPIVYEDFLPVSAAGIFQSNLGSAQATRYAAKTAKAEFEQALGRPVLDEMALYEGQQAASLRTALAALGQTELA